MKRLLTSITAAAALLFPQLSGSAQMLILDLGNVQLLPNESGQAHDFFVQNIGDPVSVDGLQFVLRVGDGTSGPKIQDVSLFAGNSVFSAAAANQERLAGSDFWTVAYSIDSAAVTIPASSQTLMARVTFDTSGIGVGSGPWVLSPSVDLDVDFTLSTFYSGASSPEISLASGSLTVVPEPATYGIATGLLLIGAAGFRKWKASLKAA
jgi:hypothetical protein